MLRVFLVLVMAVWAQSARADAALFDRLYQSGDWQTLYAEIERVEKSEDIKVRLDWLNARVRAGAPHYLTVLYGRIVWAVAEHGSNPSGKDSGVAFVTAGIMAAVADAIKCANPRAAEARASAISESLGHMFEYVETRPRDVRAQIRELVLNVEVETADRRPLDPTLCEMNVPREKWLPALAARRREIPRLIELLISDD